MRWKLQKSGKYDTAKADVSISKALFNYTKIAKSGDKTVDANYTGQAIHFTTSETIVTAFNLLTFAESKANKQG